MKKKEKKKGSFYFIIGLSGGICFLLLCNIIVYVLIQRRNRKIFLLKIEYRIIP
jgi:hypothetical protein